MTSDSARISGELEPERGQAREPPQQSQRIDAIERPAADVAHDLNNILGVIRSLSRLLLVEHQLSQSARADVTEIEQAASRAADLTRKLLSVDSVRAARVR